MNNVTKTELRAAKLHFRRFLRELKKDMLTILRYSRFKAMKFAKGDVSDVRENNALQRAMDILESRAEKESLLKTPVVFDDQYMEHENPIIAACMNNTPIKRNR